MSRKAPEPAARTSGETLRERYEHLRSLVLSGTRAWGQVADVGSLFCGGMRAWMEREPPAPRPPRLGLSPSRVTSVLESSQGQLGAIIAEMILGPQRRTIP